MCKLLQAQKGCKIPFFEDFIFVAIFCKLIQYNKLFGPALFGLIYLSIYLFIPSFLKGNSKFRHQISQCVKGGTNRSDVLDQYACSTGHVKVCVALGFAKNNCEGNLCSRSKAKHMK
jgi:hypothetical protein